MRKSIRLKNMCKIFQFRFIANYMDEECMLFLNVENRRSTNNDLFINIRVMLIVNRDFPEECFQNVGIRMCLKMDEWTNFYGIDKCLWKIITLFYSSAATIFFSSIKNIWILQKLAFSIYIIIII